MHGVEHLLKIRGFFNISPNSSKVPENGQKLPF